jgi:SMI1 / KNR4 family (SUKH-1)
MKYNDFIKELKSFGWQFEPSDKDTAIDINASINGKLAKINDDFISFIKSFNTLANKNDDTWFIPLHDYLNEEETEGFAWNEFEKDSLEYADNETQKISIENFWKNHLPFMMSVKNGYAYLAIVLDGKNKGNIVSGNEPEYEETVTIASSLDEFFEKYILVLNDKLDFPTLKLLS